MPPSFIGESPSISSDNLSVEEGVKIHRRRSSAANFSESPRQSFKEGVIRRAASNAPKMQFNPFGVEVRSIVPQLPWVEARRADFSPRWEDMRAILLYPIDIEQFPDINVRNKYQESVYTVSPADDLVRKRVYLLF